MENKQLDELLKLSHKIQRGINDNPVKYNVREATYDLIKAIYELYQNNYIISKKAVEDIIHISTIEYDTGIVVRADFHLAAVMEDRFANEYEKKYTPEIKNMLSIAAKEKILYMFETNNIGEVKR